MTLWKRIGYVVVGIVNRPLGKHRAGKKRWTKFELRPSNSIDGNAGNSPRSFIFAGRVILEMEDVWNSEWSRGTSLDGEILNRIAIYEREQGGYVAEQHRYNPRPIFLPKAVVNGSQKIPYLWLAEEFPTAAAALAWIQRGELIKEGWLSAPTDQDMRDPHGSVVRS